jgi:branched-chain amino acid transport system substrate-binding protein
MRIPKALIGTSLIAATFAPVGVLAQQPVKIGFVMFLSGPAASPFGVPAKNAADFIVEELNAGKGPVPYGKVGFGGSKIEMVQIDEAGPATSVVTEYRNLVQRSDVDLVIGYISSGNCLAIAPVAEELKKFRISSTAARRGSSRTPTTSTCSAPRPPRP